MKAITAEPGRAGSVRVEEIDAPEPAGGELLVEGLALGICGTDRELLSGVYGSAPPGRSRLVIGHESLGRVLSAPPGSGFLAGEHVVGVVRRPDPEPCGACAHGEFDMCRNGRYRERGIKELDGFGAQRWTVEPEFAVRVDAALGLSGALLEPASVVAKAWDQLDRVGARAWYRPAVAVVTGAGPIGLLAALMGRQRGLEVHVVDRVEDGGKPALVGALGAEYHAEDPGAVLAETEADVVLETTGAGPVIGAVLGRDHPYSLTALVGLGDGARSEALDLAALGTRMVLSNAVVLGSVNANVRHWTTAAEALARADGEWLASLVTRTVPLTELDTAFEHRPEDIKVLIDLQS
jgi:threonine dehydrogenase-like Zn-dependent dehydrogenase